MTEHTGAGRRSGRFRVLRVVLIVVLLLVAAAAIGAEYVLHHAEPILRARVIESLSARFNSRVELGEFHVSVMHGLDVEGKNLALRSKLYPGLPPQMTIGAFQFHAHLFDLFRSPMHVDQVVLHGLVLEVPPKSVRAAAPHAEKRRQKIKIFIGRIVCDSARLVLLTDRPGKQPLDFEIHSLTLDHVSARRPMHFVAKLVNPKPVGEIATEGNFGPWNAGEPHNTALDGTYSFENADLGAIRGIAGTLSSTGKYSGKLDTIAVEGTTDTPDFRIAQRGRAVALHTDFHATVNGTNGNTYLAPVQAHFLHTDVTAAGEVVRGEAGTGHHILLYITIARGRIEDLLRLGAKSGRPVMRGAVRLGTKLDLPPGQDAVIRRMRLAGDFSVDNVLFSSRHIQGKMDELSLRSQGRAAMAREIARESTYTENELPQTRTSLHGVFSMADEKLVFPQLVCDVPGAEIALNGTYTLDGKAIDFNGRARLQAHVSSIVGGWKGRLLKPFDPFFSKNGAGTDVPIRITGTQAEPHFGLNF